MPAITIDTSKISKSTVAGFLSGLAAVCLALPVIDTAHVLNVKVFGITALIAGVARVIVGKLEGDPDLAKATTPDGTVKDVSAHPTPDNPEDKPVLPQ